MPRRSILILPAPSENWEVWSCGRGPDCIWQGTAENPAQASAGASSVVMALPARLCRTFSFAAPTQDKNLARRLAHAQLEKRGLLAGAAGGALYECHLHPRGSGGALVSVDVIAAAANPADTLSHARGLLPFPRLFELPEGRLVIVEEQGRLILCVGAGGSLAHSQVISMTRELGSHVAPEIRIASLALQEQGVLADITGVELWGDFPPAAAQELSVRLGLPVTTRERPVPKAAVVQKEASAELLPAAAKKALAKRRQRLWRWAAAAALLCVPGGWLWSQYRQLATVEAEAARLQALVAAPVDAGSTEAEQVRALQQRWAALRQALEPRRYPLMVLNNLTRCIPSGGVVLRRYDNKVGELSVRGTARTALEAYDFYNAVSRDKELAVYAWSMAQPHLRDDGQAFFEIKGRMR